MSQLHGRGLASTALLILLGPGLALFMFVLASNLVGDALQEALNPRLEARR